MLEIWEEHGPPPFVTLSAAHLKKSSKKKKKTKEEGTGTMADLARMFGVGGKKKGASI